MALVEAALVVHLRHLYYPGDPLRIFPLALMRRDDLVLELARELATVIMLVVAARLAGTGARWFAGFVFAFGLWDLFYYAWLKVFLGWPVTWGEWDVLFLIPWPWFGPWLTPAAIALLFTAWGGWVLWRQVPVRWTRNRLLVFLAGCGLALAAFLAPAWPLLPGGEEAFAGFTPDAFAWGLYLPGVALMAEALALALRRCP